MADVIIKDGAVYRWPASVGSLKSILKGEGLNVSIPRNPQLPLIISGYTLLTPEPTAKPTGDVVKEIAPTLIDPDWTQQWSSRSFNVTEIQKSYDDKETEIIKSFDAAVLVALGKYTSLEVDSWYKQEKEAREWTANNSYPTPLLDAVALARGTTLTVLVGQIVSKANSFEVVYGGILGKKQKLSDELYVIDVNAPGAIDLINAINW